MTRIGRFPAEHDRTAADPPGRARDFVGYGRTPPRVRWPDGARVAVSLVVNYEEGAERSVPDGDASSEAFGEIRYPMPEGTRDLAAESNYEYGSRVGVWRLLDVFQAQHVHTTFFACARALERNRELGPVLRELGHEACSHGYHWGEHFRMTEAEERQEIQAAVAAIERCVGERPVGWYCRYGPSERTRRLLVEEGGFVYDSDAYNDDLPYYVTVLDRPWLVVPYAADSNDARYFTAPGFGTPEDFYHYLVATYDRLCEEGIHVPRMMSVGLHCRISGRPARAAAIARFLAYLRSRGDAWIARRDQIARIWAAQCPPVLP
jgi:peptidoglycan/xylan/chitin deacetylase (PgdA/CDA1 family)